METQKILNIALRIGTDLLKSGAEIYRVEQSITFICQAYHMEEIDVYAIPTSIMATVMKDGVYYTKIKRILYREIDLDRLDKLNSLSRWICKERPSYAEILNRLLDISQIHRYPSWSIVLANGFVGMFLTLFFGGTITDALWAFPIALIVKIVFLTLERISGNILFLNIVGGFITSASAHLLERLAMTSHVDIMSIGVLMTLVPGIAVTNGMRDLIGGDFMAALHRCIEALLVATGIALGVAAAMVLF